MKKCLIMFVFLVLSLILAAISENLNESPTDKMVSNEIVVKNQTNQ